MNRTIEKCRICGEAYYHYMGDTTDGGVCPDCQKKAEAKDYRAQNEPPRNMWPCSCKEGPLMEKPKGYSYGKIYKKTKK